MPTKLKVSEELPFMCLFAHAVRSVAQDFLSKKSPSSINKSSSDTIGHRAQQEVIDLCGDESAALAIMTISPI